MKTMTAFVAAAALGLSTAPAKADAFKPSRSKQVELGQQAANEIRKKERVLPSYDDRVRTVRRIGNDLIAAMGNTRDMPWKFTFDVIDSKQVNAFALPGGPTFIYTGLLDKIETEDQLAGVMGHELTHVTKEHWAKQYAENQKRQLGLAVLLGLAHANSTWQNVGGLVNVLKATEYSRKDESAADDGGFDMLVRAGYNPGGLSDVFRMFMKQKSGGVSIPILSDHPSDSSRIARIENKIQASNQRFPSQRPLRYEDRDYSTTSYRETRTWRTGGGN